MSDETRDPIAAIVREAMDYAADHGRMTTPEDYADRIREALATPAAPEPGGEVRTALIRETAHCAVQRVATLANMREPDGGYWLWEMRSEVVDWVVGEMKEDNEGEAWKPIEGAAPAASEDVRESEVGPSEAEMDMARTGMVIQATKTYRERVGCTLHEARAAIDAARRGEAQGEDEDPLVKEAVALIDEAVSEIAGDCQCYEEDGEVVLCWTCRAMNWSDRAERLERSESDEQA